jgi:plasmid stabilization system protein ParE
MLPVEYHPAARDELIAAAVYYEERALGLGADFLLESERTQTFLSQFPALGRQLPESSRRVSLQRFPYHIIYRVDSDRIFVLAVAHHRRQPGYWLTRQ